MALSPDGGSLVVTHAVGDAGFPLFPSAVSCPSGAVSVVNLGANSVQSFCIGDGALGVAFGNDGLALIVSGRGVQTFDPLSGAVQNIGALYCDAAVNGVLPDPCQFVFPGGVLLNNRP